LSKSEQFEVITKRINLGLEGTRTQAWKEFFESFLDNIVVPIIENDFLIIPVDTIRIGAFEREVAKVTKPTDVTELIDELGFHLAGLDKLFFGVGIFMGPNLGAKSDIKLPYNSEFITCLWDRIDAIISKNKEAIIDELVKSDSPSFDDKKNALSMEINNEWRENSRKYFEKRVTEILTEGYVSPDMSEGSTQDSKLKNLAYVAKGHIIKYVDSIDNLISTIIGAIDGVKEVDINSLFFRGHGNTAWSLKPSIKRTPMLFYSEDKVYEQTMVQNPEEFKQIFFHLDILKKMQHYNIPTRLLDITRSLSAALFFACEDSGESTSNAEVIVFNPEEVKFFRSDNVSLLSALPTFSWAKRMQIYKDASDAWKSSQMEDDQIEDFNEIPLVKQLVHEVSSEKNFTSNVQPDTLLNNFFVQPTLDNRRIISQQGAFIVSSLNPFYTIGLNKKETNDDFFNNNRLKDSGKIVHFIINVENQPKILQELQVLGVNTNTIYPEIEKTGQTLKKDFLKL